MNLEEAIFSIDLYSDKQNFRFQSGGGENDDKISLQNILIKAADFFCGIKNKNCDAVFKTELVGNILHESKTHDKSFQYGEEELNSLFKDIYDEQFSNETKEVTEKEEEQEEEEEQEQEEEEEEEEEQEEEEEEQEQEQEEQEEQEQEQEEQEAAVATVAAPQEATEEAQEEEATEKVAPVVTEEAEAPAAVAVATEEVTPVAADATAEAPQEATEKVAPAPQAPDSIT